MRLILVPTAEAVVAVNRFVCEQGGNPHHCTDIGKIESAISTAFYWVKSHAFTDGNKRTGALAAITFLNQHGMDLRYPIDEDKDINGLAKVIESCAAGNMTKEQLMDWFEGHKSYLDE